MSIFEEKIKEDIKTALRSKDEVKLSTLRMLASAIHNKKIDKRSRGASDKLSDEEVVLVMRLEAKKRRDSIQEFKKGGRVDLVEKEKHELAVLELYLPQEMSDEDLERTVKEAIVGLGRVSEKDFGRVMGEVMRRVRGVASGDRVSILVKKFLQK